MPTECRIGRNCDFKKLFHQRFSLPSWIIYYMAKNPTTPDVYEKLVRSCKYWYPKNPVIVVDSIIFREDGFSIEKSEEGIRFGFLSLTQISCKFWIHSLTVFTLIKWRTEFLRDKIFRIKNLNVYSAGVVLEQILRPDTAESVKNVCFSLAAPRHANGILMSLGKIFAFFPNLEEFYL